MTDILKDAKEFWGYERDKDRQEVSMYYDKYYGFRLIEEVERLREDRDRWKKRAEKYEKCLKIITDSMGRVCEEFEICAHVACADSSGAVLLALEALNPETTAEDFDEQ